MIPRRAFLKQTAAAAAGLGLTELGFSLPPLRAEEVQVQPAMVQLHPEIEFLVRFLEETPSDRILEELAGRIRRGLTYREILAALLLAGVRNIQPRPVGFKFHAVLVVNSAHLASLSSPDADRWLPIFWAVNQFKSSQAADVRQGDWVLSPVDEPRVPPSHRARKAFIEAMDQWDEAGADAAIVGLARSAGSHEIYELLARYGCRDFREIGHKQIYVANSFRTLEVIGWHHAEPVLRSLAFALLDRDGEKVNPAKANLPADRPFRRNEELVTAIPDTWLEGKPDSAATEEMLAVIREGSARDTSDTAVELLKRGVASRSLFDAFFTGAGELLMRSPGILSLHASTFTNAQHYAFQHCRDDRLRRMLLLQNAAFLPLFRGGSKDKGLHIDKLEPQKLDQAGRDGLNEIFALLPKDRPQAARKLLAYLADNPDPKPVLDMARRLIFLKGRDSHDYKFSSAVLEDYHALDERWQGRFLAASLFNLRGTQEDDNGLVQRTRAALQS